MIHSAGVNAPMISRTDRGRQTADRFVGAAMALVAQEGLEGLKIARVAKKLGYAVGALYRHFPSKGALLVAMQAQVVERVRSDLAAMDTRLARKTVVGDGARALAQVLAAQRVYVDLAHHHPEHFALLVLTLGDPRELVDSTDARALLPSLDALFKEVATRFDNAAALGALDPGDAFHRAMVCWASVHGVLQLRKLERFGGPGLQARRLARELGHALLIGWGARPGDIESAQDAVDSAIARPRNARRGASRNKENRR
jgi:AcrR family transcriptional regulator